MRETRISIPELALIAATRGMLGVGIGLLIAGRLGRKRRFAVGSTLAAVGALATIPLAFEVFGGGRITRTDQAATKNERPRASSHAESMTH
jgi:hypothetical protein